MSLCLNFMQKYCSSAERNFHLRLAAKTGAAMNGQELAIICTFAEIYKNCCVMCLKMDTRLEAGTLRRLCALTVCDVILAFRCLMFDILLMSPH